MTQVIQLFMFCGFLHTVYDSHVIYNQQQMSPISKYIKEDQKFRRVIYDTNI